MQDTADGGKYTKGQRSPRWAFMQTLDILAKDDSGDVYLHRLRILQTPFFAFYLHDLNLPDSDRDPHDHPWNFTSIILRGGYTEEVFDNQYECLEGAYRKPRRNTWKRWSIHKMTTEKAHRILTVEPKTVSLVIVGRRKRDWGFWTSQGWVAWQDYV